MPTHESTKPLKIRNGRAHVMTTYTEPDAGTLEEASRGQGVPVATFVHDVALRVARGLVRKGAR